MTLGCVLAIGSVASARTVTGGKGADRLVGTSRDDVMRGNGGADLIHARAGDDRIFAGDGARVFAGPGRDRVTIRASKLDFRVDCGRGRDRLTVRTPAAWSKRAVRRRVRRCEVIRVVRDAIAYPGAAPLPSPTASPSPWPPGTANLWIDSDGGTCAYSATPVAYSDAGACATTAAAYATANSSSPVNGVTVGIRSGAYRGQSVPLSSRTGGDIAFVTANGPVTISDMVIYGDKTSWTSSNGLLTFDSGVDIFGGSNSGNLATVSSANRLKGLTFDGVKAMANPVGAGCAPASCGGRALYISNAQDLTFRNSDIGYGKATCQNGSAKAVDTPVNPGSGLTVDNVVFDGDRIHDWGRDGADCGGGAAHTECMFLMSVQNWTIRNSSFFNCSIYSISLGRLSGDPDPNNVTIENNTMQPSDNFGVGDEQGYFTIVLDHVSTRFGNLRIRNNSLAQAIQVETMDVPDGTGFDQTVIESNIMHGLQACAPTGMTAPTYRNNVLDGARCGTNPTMVSNAQTLFAGRSGNWDFHLKAGGAAQGAASTVSGQFTPTDIGGKPRDSAPDAGAYEYGSGS